MFPDSTVKWHTFSSIIDGPKPPPFALSKGVWRGVLNLIMLECVPDTRAYGIEITNCLVYCAFDEMIYSIAEQGDRTLKRINPRPSGILSASIASANCATGPSKRSSTAPAGSPWLQPP